jgi:pimeloyl-ACP methyl ester carboxylesterase
MIERETDPGPYDPDDWPKHLVTVRSSDGSWRRIWVHDTGPVADDRVPVVLIGGLGLSVYETFGSFVPRLAQSHRVLAIDHPGHGGGPRDRSLGADGGPRGSDDILGEAEANIVAILGTLGIERAMIVGHSAGGAVAQKLARDYPELVERLVLVGSAMTFEDRRLRPIGLINHLPRWMRQLIAPVVFLTFAAGFGEWRRTDVHHGHPWLMFEFAAALWRFNSSTWAADLEPPAFVLVLEHDRTIRPDAQRKLAETLRAQRVWSVESGHNLRAPSRLAPRRPRTKEWKAWRNALLGALSASIPRA